MVHEMKHEKKLAELKAAGINIDPLLKNPSLFMSVAQIGPKTAHEIYKSYGVNKTKQELEKIYNKIDDKTKLEGKKLFKDKKTPENNTITSSEKKKPFPLNILKEQKIPLEDILGVFKVILGTTGQGKSNTVAVIIEEYLKYDVPVHIIDVEGEHLSFHKEMDFEVLNKKKYGKWKEHLEKKLKGIIKNRENLIVDLSTFDEEEKWDFLKDYLKNLWELEDKYRIPLSLVIEEVHTLIPQGKNTPVKNLLQDFAKRGRKRKIEVTFITQRAQEAEKSIITQAETAFLHKVSHPGNLAIYRVLIPGKEEFNHIPEMKVGEIFYVNKGSAKRGMVRLRNTKHGSHTMSIKDLKKPRKLFGVF